MIGCDGIPARFKIEDGFIAYLSDRSEAVTEAIGWRRMAAKDLSGAITSPNSSHWI
jgi:hypothetical protein